MTDAGRPWRVAARIVIDNPKRAGWALGDAFGEKRKEAWGAFRDLFADMDGWRPGGLEEMAIAYCLMAAVCDWEEAEAARERRDRLLNPTPDLDEDPIFREARQRQEKFEDVSTALDYDSDCSND
jgi:hypothetical protein